MDIKDYLPEYFFVSKELLDREPDSVGCRQMLVELDEMTFNIIIGPNNEVNLIFVYTSSPNSDVNFFRNFSSVDAHFVPDESGGGTIYLKKRKDGD